MGIKTHEKVSFMFPALCSLFFFFKQVRASETHLSFLCVLFKKQEENLNKKGSKEILRPGREGGQALFYPMISPQFLFFCGYDHGSPAQHHLPV